MSRIFSLPLFLAFPILLSGCGQYRLADQATQIVINKFEYQQLKALAAQPTQVGRYQMIREGNVVRRFDTATGRECVLLASDAFFRSDMSKQTMCFDDDRLAATERHNLYPDLYDTNGATIPQARFH
jgi:hypothetical protein